MIRSKDVNVEVKKLDELATSTDNSVVTKGVLKAITLLVKLVRDIRTNQVAMMKKQGIELIKEEGRDV
jgi:hypothetical protein